MAPTTPLQKQYSVENDKSNSAEYTSAILNFINGYSEETQGGARGNPQRSEGLTRIPLESSDFKEYNLWESPLVFPEHHNRVLEQEKREKEAEFHEYWGIAEPLDETDEEVREILGIPRDRNPFENAIDFAFGNRFSAERMDAYFSAYRNAVGNARPDFRDSNGSAFRTVRVCTNKEPKDCAGLRCRINGTHTWGDSVPSNDVWEEFEANGEPSVPYEEENTFEPQRFEERFQGNVNGEGIERILEILNNFNLSG